MPVNLRRVLAPLADDAFQPVAAATEDSRRRLGFLLCGYVLMPDHWHALSWTVHLMTISCVVQNIKWISACLLNDERRIAGPVWQHQILDRFVHHRKELAVRFDYMHLNPVRKGLVSKPEGWQWSSCNNFALDKEQVRHRPVQIDYVRLPEGYQE